MHRQLGFAVALVGLAWAAAPAVAQDAMLAQLYGNGVHQYFAGRTVAAEQSFTASIDGGYADPRCYYFRGLNRLRMGDSRQARQDFQEGARLEAQSGDTRSVGKALERIQGPARLLIEQYRAGGQVYAARTRQSQKRQRLRESDEAVYERLDEPVGKPAPALLPVPAGSASPAPPQPQAAPAAPKPTTPAATNEAETPAADEPKRETSLPTPAEADPFAEPQPAEADPFAQPKTEADPPAEMNDEADDPFGADESAKPAVAAETLHAPGAAQPESDEDPFGAPEGNDETKTDEPAPAEEDPFGAAGDEPKPAAGGAPAPEADEDPFGAPEGNDEAKTDEPAPAEEDPFGAAEG